MATLIPIYFQIKQTIKGWILNKEYSPGEKIPSENELAEKFQVSRITVRQAISQLVQEAFLISKRGEGTFVTQNENLIGSFSLESQGVMDELFFHQICKVQTRWAEIHTAFPSKVIKEKLELPSHTREVVQIKRVRFLKDRPFSYITNYLPKEIGMKIHEQQLYEKPLLRILEQDLSIRFTEAVQTIEASFANPEIADKLRIAIGSPMLFVERIMYGPKHKPIEIFQGSYQGDLYKLIVRFKKVIRKNGSRWVHRQDLKMTGEEQ